MNTKPAMLLAILLMGSHLTEAQTPDIKFVQGDTLSLEENKKGYYEIELYKEPFTIIYKGKELHVCAGLDEELFQFTKPDTDINADFNSYFFIFKYLAASEDADFLSIEENTGNSLNKTHGAQAAGGGLYQYTVRSLLNDGDSKPLSEFNRLFLALWLDSNKDQYIDKEELLWVRANIK